MSIYPTAYYEAHGIPTCPNGDKVRSDEAGLFCLINGVRVPYPVAALGEPSPAAIKAATTPITPAPAVQSQDFPTPATMAPPPLLPTVAEVVPTAQPDLAVEEPDKKPVAEKPPAKPAAKKPAAKKKPAARKPAAKSATKPPGGVADANG